MITYPIGLLRPKNLVNSFKLTINTALGTGTTFTLPLPSGQTYDFWWNPGDGSPDRHVVAYNDVNATYDYGVAFSGQVLIGTKSGDKCGGWSFDNGGDKLKVTSIDNWGNIGFDYLTRAFSGCSNMVSISGTNATLKGSLTNFCLNCTSLTTVDFDNADFSLVTNINNLMRAASSLSTLNTSNWYLPICTNIAAAFFGCSNILVVDTSNWGVTPTTMSFFVFGCSSLISLDVSGINTASASNISSFASGCSSLITCDTSSWDTSNFTIVESAFNGTISLTSSFLNTSWWDNINITSYANCFTNDLLIPEYVSIPFEWKGMVEVGTLTTDQTTLQQVGINRTYTGIAEINWGDGSFTRTTSAVEALKDYGSTGTYDIKLGAAAVNSTTSFNADNNRITNITNLKTGLLIRLDLRNNLLTGALDMSLSPISVVLLVDGNSGLTSFNFATSGNGKLTAFYFFNCNITGRIDLATPNITVGADIRGYNNANFTGIDFATTGNSILTNWRMYGCAIVSQDFTNVPLSGILWFYDNFVTTTLTFAASGNGAIIQFYADNNLLPNIDFSVFPTSSPTIRMFNNSLTATEHDNQLINLDGTGWINGFLVILTGNTARTAASDTAYNNLIANGWTIT